LTVTDKQAIRKKLNINHKNTHINTIQIKENKQRNIRKLEETKQRTEEKTRLTNQIMIALKHYGALQ